MKKNQDFKKIKDKQKHQPEQIKQKMNHYK